MAGYFHMYDSISTGPLPTNEETEPLYTVEMNSDPLQHLCLLPIGKTGSGKSSLLNTLLNDNLFKAKSGARSVTDKITERTGIWNIDGDMRKVITVADTPGFGDSMNRDDQFRDAFHTYIGDVGERMGIDAFLLVFQYDSSLNNVMSILESFDSMMDVFEPKTWWDYVVLVFTRVDYYPNLKFPASVLLKKQIISENLILAIQKKFSLKHAPKYAFMSSKPRNCSHAKKGVCDCSAVSKYHLDQMRTLKSRISSLLTENKTKWKPST
ncbi:P-loop containing nucleoside triphosphate hydrolase protein [Sporodiniella umbellata]|nr:P-loop containing nucleoside triphosphate hydrolase protein [Sporodiniella umbellata]